MLLAESPNTVNSVRGGDAGVVLGKLDGKIETRQHRASDFTNPFPDTKHARVGGKFDGGSTASNVLQCLGQLGLDIGNCSMRSPSFDDLQSLIGCLSPLRYFFQEGS